MEARLLRQTARSVATKAPAASEPAALSMSRGQRCRARHWQPARSWDRNAVSRPSSPFQNSGRGSWNAAGSDQRLVFLAQNGNGLDLDQEISTGKRRNSDPSASGQLVRRKEAEQSFPHGAGVLPHEMKHCPSRDGIRPRARNYSSPSEARQCESRS